MSKTIIPKNYKSSLGIYDTQVAIGLLRKNFQENLCKALNLKRVTAPLFVAADSGLNDDLNGIERPVSFDILETGNIAQIVHSLAKWKRMALYKYNFNVGEGLYTDMNAVRRDEEMDNIHSIYVDQWDWEKVINRDDRNITYLKDTVRSIVNAVCDTSEYINSIFKGVDINISRDVSFITTQELEDLYPNLTPKERENEYLKEHKTAFVMKIGGMLKSGIKHDGRAPDYDDWELNGDILVWNDVLKSAFEISSMGIRVDSESLDRQLKLADADYRRDFPFHKLLLEDKLPLTVGGGIGQSRLCMLLLGKCHIGEVQVSVWDDDTLTKCSAAGVNIL